MGNVLDEIKAFQNIQAQLESQHMGKWVLIRDRELVSVYESFEDAARDAVRRFGSGPFLIRQVGAPPVTLPVSVLYHHTDAQR